MSLQSSKKSNKEIQAIVVGVIRSQTPQPQQQQQQQKQQHGLDTTIIEYIVNILAGATPNDFPPDGNELSEILSPLLFDAGCVSSDAQVELIAQDILSKVFPFSKPSNNNNNNNNNNDNNDNNITLNNGEEENDVDDAKLTSLINNGGFTTLNTPINMSAISEKNELPIPSWMQTPATPTNVDQKALEAVKQKQKIKLEKRNQKEEWKKKKSK